MFDTKFENLTCAENQIPSSLFILYTIIFMEYYVLIFDLLFLKTRQHLRCNLLFGLIGHCGPLKDVNISFFVSFFDCLFVFRSF